MTITMPRTDIVPADWFAEQDFRLFERQEFSRTAGGLVLAKSMGSALWTMDCTTKPLPRDEALDYEAKIHSLDGSVGTFYAGDLRRIYPKAYPTGDFSESGVAIYAIGEDNKSLRLDGLPAGFILSRGDFVSFPYGASSSRALHQVMETVTADGSGISPIFEVRPHLRPGVAIDDVVTLKSPQAVFRMTPGSLSVSHMNPFMSNVSFSAVQVL